MPRKTRDRRVLPKEESADEIRWLTDRTPSNKWLKAEMSKHSFWRSLSRGQQDSVFGYVGGAFDMLPADRLTYLRQATAGEVRVKLMRLRESLVELDRAIDSLDWYTAGHLKSLENDLSCLQDQLGPWVKQVDLAARSTPRQDRRKPREPALKQFIRFSAEGWDKAGIPFRASRKRDGAPTFLHALLVAYGLKVSLSEVTKVAQTVVRERHQLALKQRIALH